MISTQVIYVIGAGENPVKIGIASSIAERLAGLQTGNPDPLTCHHFVRVPASRALAVEQAAHSAFSDRRRLGEWFNVHWQEAAKLLDDLAAVEAATSPEASLLAVLRTEYGMKAEGQAAIWDYLDRQDRGEPYVAHANGHILKRVGTASYAAFSLVIAQQKVVSGLSPKEMEAAKQALAKAINALVNFRTNYGRAMLQSATRREMERKAATPSLRPPSLPPIRVA